MIAHPALGGIPLVLGGNVFGWTAKGDAGFAVLDAFYEAGGRMIDTADVYSAWVPGHQGGESETVIGQWLESRGVRGEMLIHTKTGMLGGKELYEPQRVLRSLGSSLERLRTDYVDLYYAHIDYEDVPIGEIVAAFDGAAASGKARTLGASKFSAARLSAALEAADVTGATPFTVLQDWYNLVEREHIGPEMRNLCAERGIPIVPFFSLANGYLTGKYRSLEDVGSSVRAGRVTGLVASGAPVLAVMDEVAAETGASLAQIALAWLRAQPGIAAPLASATSARQVQDLCAAGDLALSDDQLSRLSLAG